MRNLMGFRNQLNKRSVEATPTSIGRDSPAIQAKVEVVDCQGEQHAHNGDKGQVADHRVYHPPIGTKHGPAHS